MSARRAGQTALVRPSSVVMPVVSLLLAVGLTGCGGSDPEPAPTKAPTSPAPTDAAGDVDVCGLVPKALREKAFPGDTPPTTKLAYGSENVVVCGTPATATVEFGYAVAEGATMPKPRGDEVTKLAGFDDAVQEKGSGPPGTVADATLWARAHGITFFVRDNAVLNSGGTAVSLDTAKQVLKALVSSVVPATVEQTAPIGLGPRCPAADSAVVTDVVGTVVTARGGAQDADEPECQYLGEGGTRVDATVLVQDGVEKTFFQPEYDKRISMRGAKSAWTDKEPVGDGQVSLMWTTASDILWSIDASPLTFGSDDQEGAGNATLANVQDLGRAYMRANPDVGR